MRFFAMCLSLLLIPIWCAEAQSQNRRATKIDFSDPSGIIHQLAPDDGAPTVLVVRPSDKPRVISLLNEAKRKESGWHRQLAIYFLMCLDQDYKQNRDDLLRIWRSGGDEDTMGLIIHLYKQGHSELLDTILKAGRHSDGALSEELGDFFGNELNTHPNQIVAGLSQFSFEDQAGICWMAGAGDGGGIARSTLVQVLGKLAKIEGKVAARCAANVRKGARDAAVSNQ
jgi:hypothetical protein